MKFLGLVLLFFPNRVVEWETLDDVQTSYIMLLLLTLITRMAVTLCAVVLQCRCTDFLKSISEKVLHNCVGSLINLEKCLRSKTHHSVGTFMRGLQRG
jgi:hypothetical protein